MEVHHKKAEPWKVTLVDTGENTLTGGRLKRVREYLDNEDDFCFTYGDGVSNIDIAASIAFHRKQGKLATISAVAPPGRYGALQMNDNLVNDFVEKPAGDGGMINGGFFVLSPKVINMIEGDRTSWEGEPLKKLAEMGEMAAFVHDGFWQPMDTLREKNMLEELWAAGEAPWKIW
jgi:glucose-1-phosphate cytidylyltransferase